MLSNQLAKINIAKKQLDMDEDTYRVMLHAQTGKRSLKEMNHFERDKVIHHLKKCGAKFTTAKKAGTRPHNYQQLPAYVTKVEALLADMKLSWRYADSIARNITGGNGGTDKDPGVEKLAWVKKAQHWRDIIAALSVEQEKRNLLSQVDELLESINKQRDYIDQQWPGINAKWPRQREKLKQLIAELQSKHNACFKGEKSEA